MAESYTPNEIMTIEAARRLKNGTVCFVGIGMPSAAANLARLTHAPEVVLNVAQFGLFSMLNDKVFSFVSAAVGVKL